MPFIPHIKHIDQNDDHPVSPSSSSKIKHATLALYSYSLGGNLDSLSGTGEEGVWSIRDEENWVTKQAGQL